MARSSRDISVRGFHGLDPGHGAHPSGSSLPEEVRARRTRTRGHERVLPEGKTRRAHT